MDYRMMGKTDLQVSVLGFGCGSVGGLLVRGDYGDMVRVVERAIERGVTYFDTATSYGNGTSETNLGKVMRDLGVTAGKDIIVGTKVRLTAEDMADIPKAVVASVDGSLERLQLEQVDLIQLHNRIVMDKGDDGSQMTFDEVQVVVETFQQLHNAGKVRWWGITGLGETPALHQAIDQGNLHTVQSCYNLLNPSAGQSVPDEFGFQNYEQLIDKAAEQGMGVIGIRALAAGALSGTTTRVPNAATGVAPISTGKDLADDVAHARAFQFLVEEGHAGTLAQAAVRFAISKPELSTALVGVSNMEQLEQAVDAAERGPLPADALGQLPGIWAEMPAA